MEKMSKFNTPKNEKKLIKFAQSRRYTILICEHVLDKVRI